MALIPHPRLPTVGEGEQNRQSLSPTLGIYPLRNSRQTFCLTTFPAVPNLPIFERKMDSHWARNLDRGRKRDRHSVRHRGQTDKTGKT